MIFSIWNGVGCQRKGPKFGTTVMSMRERGRQRDRQVAVSSRVSPANQLARLPWLTTFPRNVNCSFLPFNHQHHRQPHRPWPHTNAASQIPSSLSPPEGPSRVSPVCVCSSSAPLQIRPSKRDFFFSPQTPVMALGPCFPLQSSASQDLSLFGAHPIDMTARYTRGWPFSPPTPT